MLGSIVLRPLNHLLRQSGWASRQLSPFADRVASLQLGRLAPLNIQVDAAGLFAQAPSAAATDVVIALPDDTLTRLLTDRRSIFSAATISGRADFAETLGLVFRNLRWDAEADLANVVGDVLAHRLAAGGSQFVAWQGAAINRLFGSVLEYSLEEKQLLVTNLESTKTGRLITELATQTDALEQRLCGLEEARQ